MKGGRARKGLKIKLKVESSKLKGTVGRINRIRGLRAVTSDEYIAGKGLRALLKFGGRNVECGKGIELKAQGSKFRLGKEYRIRGD